MKRTLFRIAVACSVIAAGCGSGDSDHGAYVLLDQEARQAGLSLQVGDTAITSALPVHVTTDSVVSLVGADGQKPLAVGKGELVFVRGAEAHVDHLHLGKNVALDQLHLEGDEVAAKELASRLGGRITPDGSGWRLTLADVFTKTAGLHAPDNLAGAAPVAMKGALAPSAPAERATAQIDGVPPAPAALAQEQPSPPEAAAALVTLERAAVSPIARPASPVAFTAARGCRGVAGTWRGRVYSEFHSGYYDFTLQVAQRSLGSPALEGTIVAHYWDAPRTHVNAPTTCAGDAHGTIVQSASGTLESNGTMRFEGKTWRVGTTFCGTKMADYSLDKFEARLAAGAATSEATASDDAVWVDGLEIDLTRVSCQ